jgi:hypothetical protein
MLITACLLWRDLDRDGCSNPEACLRWRIAGLELQVRFMPTYVELRSCFGVDSEFCGDSRVG